MQNRQHPLRLFVGDMVKEALGFAAKGDDSLVAQAREMLRQGRLAEFHPLAQGGDAEFAFGREMAQDE